jgi:protein-disulfide isomerase
MRLSTAADVATVVTALAAVALVGKVLTGDWRGREAASPARQSHYVEGWESLASGRRLGPENASVTIIEWGDYQCPACRWFAAQVRQVRAVYPGELNIIYRHWPLPSHQYAYAAARAAECAADGGGSFEVFHELLYAEDNWLGGAFEKFARAAGVADMLSFTACSGSEMPVERIEADIAAAKALGSQGTPTIIVNGVLMAHTPSAAELEVFIEDALRTQSRR